MCRCGRSIRFASHAEAHVVVPAQIALRYCTAIIGSDTTDGEKIPQPLYNHTFYLERGRSFSMASKGKKRENHMRWQDSTLQTQRIVWHHAEARARKCTG